ncbi:hypothetical protein CICLE_v10004178mg, partial [Citrus x clementina]
MHKIKETISQCNGIDDQCRALLRTKIRYHRRQRQRLLRRH